MCLDVIMNNRNALISHNYLFRLDFQFDTSMVGLKNIDEVISFRERLYLFGQNPYDFEFKSHSLLAFLINLSQFIEAVVPMISNTVDYNAVKIDAYFCRDLDQKLTLCVSTKLRFKIFKATTPATQLALDEMYLF